MAKRSADDAGLNEPQNEENNEEIEEHDEEYEDEGAGGLEGEEEGEGDMEDDGSSGNNSDASSDTPDSEYIRGFALSWLEDKRIDGVSPQRIFESLGMKVVCLSLSVRVCLFVKNKRFNVKSGHGQHARA